MDYLVNGSTFSVSYQSLKDDYYRFCGMTDKEFVKRATLLEVLHFCCVCGYVKELGIESTLSDKGVIHELVHLLLGIPVQNLREIRAQFEAVMKLA
jgi:hypothetical protein